MGMKSFSIMGQTRLKFSSSLGTTCTLTSNISYKKLTFMYLSMKYRTCPGLNPYYYSTTGLCYDICPTGTYGDNSTMMCLPCNYTCFTCSAFAICTSCNSGTNRYLNGTSCVPSSGYYDGGVAIAISCNNTLANCTACTNSTTCTQCSAGSFVTPSKVCNLCSTSILNCL